MRKTYAYHNLKSSMVVKTNELSYQYPQSQELILDGINLQIDKGESVALLGDSGSGKSTLFNLITSFYSPTNGNIEFDGISFRDIAYIRQSAIDMVFPWKTVQENIEFGLKKRKLLNNSNRNKVSSLLHVLQLGHRVKHYPSGLSGGELKRLSFACALSCSPKLILLDEAFTGIDFSLKWKLWSLLNKEIQLSGAATITITHDFDEAIFLADRILFINKQKQIDSREILVKRENTVDIEGYLSGIDFQTTKAKVLSLYKSIHE